MRHSGPGPTDRPRHEPGRTQPQPPQPQPLPQRAQSQPPQPQPPLPQPLPQRAQPQRAQPQPPQPQPPQPRRLFPTPAAGTAGVGLAIGGFLVGTILASILVAIVVAISHLHYAKGLPPETLPVTVVDLVGLWTGFLAAALLASRLFGSRRPARDLGLSLRLWPDVPLGVAVGLGSQFLLLPLVYLPLQPYVPHLDKTLSHPGVALTGHVHGAAFVVLAVFVVVGAPIAEELFFRGVLLRSLDAWFGPLGRRAGPVLAVLVMGALFGLAHGEGLVLAYGLAVFGVVLGVMANLFRRLGPGMVAHATFNLASIVVLALMR